MWAYNKPLLARLGWHGVYPLWGEDSTQLANYFGAHDSRAMLSCVDTQQLDPQFCGRDF